MWSTDSEKDQVYFGRSYGILDRFESERVVNDPGSTAKGKAFLHEVYLPRIQRQRFCRER
jgi:hypothetical protein